MPLSQFRYLCCIRMLATCAALGCTPTQRPCAPTGTPLATENKAASPAEPAAPTGRLPQDVRPLSYALQIEIVPSHERFSGKAQIGVLLMRATSLIWLHGKNLHVSSARAVVGQHAVQASYTQYNDDGLARLAFAAPLPAGHATLELIYDAPYDVQLEGLYKVVVDKESYAFTQFEAVSARQAFPCFDEPAFKTPFDIILDIEANHTAISNTPELSSEPLPGGLKRVRFALTKPLPSYLMAFIVGPLHVVEAQPIPSNAVRSTPLSLRGIAVRGRGERLRYALDHTAPLVAELERYFGIPYPFEKLDLIAVPDFGAGAMENAGAITFREWFLMLDERSAPESQRRAFASVAAHEISHHWFGNLVTMAWWDDIWLNEAFATFLAARTVAAVYPEHRADASQLASVLGTMDSDSRVSARKVRQPIESTHDIANAFDGITYQKGAGVLAMFERYLGAETFRQALTSHLRAHAYGTATASDLLASLSKASGKDVAPAMSSFLDQVGVPLLTASVQCGPATGAPAVLRLSQSRYLPVGSSGSAAVRWQLPLCVRYEVSGKIHETCSLLTEPTAQLPLEGHACPAWLMPNADGAGYYRFALATPDLAALRNLGFAKLIAREKQSLVDSLRAGFSSGALSAEDMLATLPILAADPDRAIATAPLRLLRFTRDYLLDETDRPALDRFAKKLYAARVRSLGFAERPNEDGETKLLRGEMLDFFARVLRDPETRTTAARLGQRELGFAVANQPKTKSLPPDLRNLAALIAMQDGDQALFDAVCKHLPDVVDPSERGRLLGALASVTDARAPKALLLSLDPMLRVNEVLLPLRAQLDDPRTRDAAWSFFETHFDAFVGRISKQGAAGTTGLATPFCSKAMAERVTAFFAPRIEGLGGGPRSLAAAQESLRLCAAQVEQQRAGARAFFAQHP